MYTATDTDADTALCILVGIIQKITNTGTIYCETFI